MIITTITGYDDEYYRSRLLIKGLETQLDFLDGDSEDNDLSRNFKDCYQITNYLKKIYELGLRGEKIKFKEIEDNNIFSDNYEG